MLNKIASKYLEKIAKDFYRTGKLFITFAPTIEEYDELHFVNCQRDIPEGAEVIKDLKPYILALAEKMNLENKKYYE